MADKPYVEWTERERIDDFLAKAGFTRLSENRWRFGENQFYDTLTAIKRATLDAYKEQTSRLMHKINEQGRALSYSRDRVVATFPAEVSEVRKEEGPPTLTLRWTGFHGDAIEVAGLPAWASAEFKDKVQVTVTLPPTEIACGLCGDCVRAVDAAEKGWKQHFPSLTLGRVRGSGYTWVCAACQKRGVPIEPVRKFVATGMDAAEMRTVASAFFDPSIEGFSRLPAWANETAPADAPVKVPMILDRHPDRDFGRKAIGYWRRFGGPDPHDYVDPHWDEDERNRVVAYLNAGKVLESWRAISSCRFCGCSNGSTCLGDDTYVWPEGFAHYLVKHGVRPPEEFVQHVFARTP